MNQFGISDKSYHLILQYFTSQERIEKVVIFGSRALGTYRNGSDIDVAVWGKDWNDIAIKTDLEELSSPYMYGVIDYDKLDNEKLKNHIDVYGKLLFVR